MPYHVDRSRISESTRVDVSDMTISGVDGLEAVIGSEGDNLPVVGGGDLFFLRGGVSRANQGLWKVVDRNPTTSMLKAKKQARPLPEQQLRITGGQFWHAGRLHKVRTATIPPAATTIDFADVLYMDLTKKGTGTGRDGPE